jgi:uncharacterized protein (DUF952 family)
MLIYHIVLPNRWESLDPGAAYQAESLETEGFIHCSFAGQVDAVLERYYADADKVLILEIDPDRLRSPLVEEPSTNNEIYPHVYGPIDRDAIIGIQARHL